MPRVRPPRRDELEALRSLECDAARAFAGIGMPEIAEDEPLPVGELEAYRARGRAWVAVDEGDRPVAYLLSTVIDDCLHVAQVTVSPSHARRPLGAAPYHERLGFVVVEPADQGPELAALVAHEAAMIPGEAPRVAMRRPLGTARGGASGCRAPAR
jgi:hypothetical protein